MCACVPVLRGLLHLLVRGAVRGCVVGPGLLPRPATPGWGVGARVCLCARPACTPPFLGRVCCVGVCAGFGFRLCPAPFGWVVGVCLRSCVCPACPRPSWGAACGAGVCGCCRWWGLPPPPAPLVFFWGGLCGVGRWLSRSWVSWSLSPHPFSSGLRCFFFFSSQRGVCLRVLGVPFPSGLAAPSLVLPVLARWSPGAPFGGPVFGAVWVGGLAASCGVGGRFGGCGLFSPPPPCFFFGGGVCLFLPLPSLDWRTHWLAFSVAFRFAVGGCVLPGRALAPWVGWVMYTLGSAPLPAGLGSGSAGWAVAPGGFSWPSVSRVLLPPRCRCQLSGGGLCGWTATVVAGRAVAPCRCVAGWCGSFRGVR